MVPAYASPMRSSAHHVNSQWAAFPPAKQDKQFCLCFAISLQHLVSLWAIVCTAFFSLLMQWQRSQRLCISMHYKVGWVGFAGLKSAVWKYEPPGVRAWHLNVQSASPSGVVNHPWEECISLHWPWSDPKCDTHLSLGQTDPDLPVGAVSEAGGKGQVEREWAYQAVVKDQQIFQFHLWFVRSVGKDAQPQEVTHSSKAPAMKCRARGTAFLQ